MREEEREGGWRRREEGEGGKKEKKRDVGREGEVEGGVVETVRDGIQNIFYITPE